MCNCIFLHELKSFFFLHRAREALRTCLPEQLKDSTFAVTLKDDSTTKKWLSQLLQNLGIESQLVAIAANNTANNSANNGAGNVSAAPISQ